MKLSASVGLASSLLTLLVVGAAFWLAPGEPEASRWVKFFGRFHTLAVHLPIGLVLLVLLAELGAISTRIRAKLDPALGFIWQVLVLSAAVATLLGVLLARGSSYPAHLLDWHRGLSLAMLAWVPLCAWLFRRALRSGARLIYRAALVLLLGLMSVGAHFGGSMTQGEGYLTRFAPSWLGGAPRGELEGGQAEQWREAEAEALPEASVWGQAVLPLLEKYCVECHNPEDAQGKLELHTLPALFKGGNEGPSVIAGNSAKSNLVARMRLPLSDDERMPPEGSVQPSAAEVELIAWWIDRGAKESLLVADVLPPEEAKEVLLRQAVQAQEKLLPQLAAPALEATQAAEARDQDGADAGAQPNEEPAARDQQPGSEQPSPALGSKPGAAQGADSAAGLARGDGASVWERFVAPILAEKCGSCHSEANSKGNYRVDSRQRVIAGGKAGAGVVPGDSAQGSLLGRIRSTHRVLHMPPYREPQLSGAELELLVWWVEKGAGEQLLASAVPAQLVSRLPRGAGSPRVQVSKKNSSRNLSEAATNTRAGEVDELSDAGAPVASLDAALGAPAGTSALQGPTSSAQKPASAISTATRDGHLRPQVQLYSELVEPILAQRCGACHSGEQAIGLRVEDLGSLIESGQVIPKDPEASPLLARMRLPLNDSARMPPAASPQPDPWELQVLELWVREGAGAALSVPQAVLPKEAQARLVARPSGAPKPASELPPGAGCSSCSLAAPRGSSLAWVFGALPATGLVLRRRRWRFASRLRLKNARRGD